MDEQKVLEALAKLTETVEKGFSGMDKRFGAIESRLGQQEKKAQRTARQQRLQAAEIDKLKHIVRRLARQDPVRTYDDASAIRKEGAYRQGLRRLPGNADHSPGEHRGGNAGAVTGHRRPAGEPAAAAPLPQK